MFYYSLAVISLLFSKNLRTLHHYTHTTNDHIFLLLNALEIKGRHLRTDFTQMRLTVFMEI
jgi:hypothetical protein